MNTPPRPAVRLPPGFRERFHVVEEAVTIGSESFVLARPRDAESLISEEDFDRDERLPYWADVWPSSFALAESLLSSGATGRGRRAIELGCGVGLVACAAVRAGFELTATDYYHDAVDFATANVLANTGERLRARHLDWRAVPPDIGTFDLVLAADVLYERAYGPLLGRVVCELLAPGGTAWVADPGRVAAGAFLDALGELGARVRSQRSHRVTVAGREHDITLLEIAAPLPR